MKPSITQYDWLTSNGDSFDQRWNYAPRNQRGTKAASVVRIPARRETDSARAEFAETDIHDRGLTAIWLLLLSVTDIQFGTSAV